MKKLMLTLTFTACLLCIPVAVHADMLFQKSAENPLPVHTSFTDWTQKGIYQPAVIHDESGYRMWYASAGETSFAIAYATSSDGIHWDSGNLLRLPTAGTSVYNPFAVPANDGFTVFFSMDEPGKKARLMSITQRTDGSYDTNTIADVLSPSEQWEANGLFGPFMVSENAQPYLFYSAWGNRGFQIGMAHAGTSGMEKCTNNPVITDTIADSPHIIEKDGVKYLFYHSGEGIRAVSSTDAYSCTMHWSSPKTVLTPGPEAYDSNLMIAPSVLVIDNNIAMYYAGLGSNGWTLNMASTSNPTSPPAAVTHPVVFVPGLFASWNKNALLYTLPVSWQDWTLNPAVHEYDGILNTFKALGYEQGTDLYVFNYDWRKSIQGVTGDMNTFMETIVKPAHGSDVRIVGHSLGGLVARTYMQKYHPSYVSKLVTVGSPHKGAALSYKAAAGGDIEATNDFEWLMQKTLVQVYRDGLKTDKQILNEHLPIISDLLPVYGPYLTRRDGSKVQLSSMSVTNTVLPQYADTSALTDTAHTIAGIGTDTIEGYRVKDRSVYDTLLGLYPDGRPTETVKGAGDGIVPLSSALSGSVQQSGDHGQIIYRKNDIAGILDALQIQYDPAKIVEGKKTTASPSLLFLVFSPVRLELHHKDKTYTESEGMLFVEQPEEGEYTLKAIGTGKGTYRVLIGQAVGDTMYWTTIRGEITASVPSTQVDTYPLYFNFTDPLRNPSNIPGSLHGFDMFLEKLVKANAAVGRNKLDEAVHMTRNAKSHFGKHNSEPTRHQLLAVIKMLYDKRTKEHGSNAATLTELITDLESLMIDIFKQPSPGYTLHSVKSVYTATTRRFEQTQGQILKEIQRKKRSSAPTAELEAIQHKLEDIAQHIEQGNLPSAEILLFSVQRAIEEIK